jgi:hypothetical protein
VLFHGQPREDAASLLDDTHARAGQGVAADAGNVPARDDHAAVNRLEQPGHDPHERRLARPVRAEHGQHLSRLDAHVDAVQDLDLAVSGPDVQ